MPAAVPAHWRPQLAQLQAQTRYYLYADNADQAMSTMAPCCCRRPHMLQQLDQQAEALLLLQSCQPLELNAKLYDSLAVDCQAQSASSGRLQHST